MQWTTVDVKLNKETLDFVDKIVKENEGVICPNCVVLTAVFNYLMEDKKNANKRKSKRT